MQHFMKNTLARTVLGNLQGVSPQISPDFLTRKNKQIALVGCSDFAANGVRFGHRMDTFSVQASWRHVERKSGNSIGFISSLPHPTAGLAPQGYSYGR
jgi:hypothetical protein